MHYYATASGPDVTDALAAGLLRLIVTPLARNKPRAGVRWCADNGAFAGTVSEAQWWAWLTDLPHRELCDFAVAPDVVADAAATLDRAAPWLPRIRELGIPAAFVAQDGSDAAGIPWGSFDVLFLGGSTEYKLGPVARDLAADAVARGVPVHMGRVNSERRLRYADAIGCTSADGTLLTYGSRFHMPRLLAWLDAIHTGGTVASSTVWTSEATALRCPYCHASPGARCRAAGGRYASQPHVGRLVPSFTCPACGTVDVDPVNVTHGYCSTCHDWTGRGKPARAAQDVLAW